MSQLFTSGGQSVRVSALTSVFPMNTQYWSPLGWTDWIFLQSKGLSRVFSNTTVQLLLCFSFVGLMEGWGRQWQPPPLLLPGKSKWMEGPAGLQSMGSRRVGHDWETSLSLLTFMLWRRKWQPTSVFLPGESQGWGTLVGCRLWCHTESDTTEAT